MNSSRYPRTRPGQRAVAGLGASFALGVAALTGCSAVAGTGTSADETAASAETRPDDVQAVNDANSDQTVVNEDEWSTGDAVDVALTGDGAESGSSAVSSDDRTVTISEAGVYRLTGSLDGSLVIDAPDDAQVVLILDGVRITAADEAAIRSASADDLAIHLADGSENEVVSSGAYAEDADANAAIWSDGDLTISGDGRLEVDGRANDAVTSKDDLVVLSGALDITAVDDGLRGKDSLTVRGGTIVVDAGGDGLTSDQDEDETRGWVLIEGGSLDVTAGSDGIDGFTDVVVTGGEIAISAEEGIEAGTVGITGGTVDIASTDDGINGSAGSAETTATEGTADGQGAAVDAGAADAPPAADADGMPEPPTGAEEPANGERPEMPADGGTSAGGPGGGMGAGMADTGEWVLIEGGVVTIDAEGDGIDSNGSLDISGGAVTVYGPSNAGNGALDANGEITVSGGSLLALDSGGMSETPSADSTQAWVAASASGEKGATVEVVADDGTTIASGTATKAFGAVIASSGDVADGDYSILVDGEEVAAATAGEALAGGGGAPRG